MNTQDSGASLRSILAANLRYYRSLHAWSQEELAEQSQTGQHYISEIERGTRWPTPEKLATIAQALGVRIEALFVPRPVESGNTPLNKEELIESVIARLKDDLTQTINRVRAELLTEKR